MKTEPDSPPVSDHLHVVVYKDYVHTSQRRISLCVVKNGCVHSLRFYKYRWDSFAATWKVDLARFSVSDVDLCQLAADAIDLARAYKIELNWPSLVKIARV